VIVVVGAVEVSLQGRPLGNLDQNLIHDVMGYIGGQHIEDKAVSSSEREVV